MTRVGVCLAVAALLTSACGGEEPAPVCQNTCTTELAGQCTASGQISICTRGPDGCLAFASPVDCAAGKECKSGECVDKAPTCTDKCAAQAARCAAQGLQYCQKGADGCLDWGTPTPCPTGQTCQVDRCALSCTNECSAGATRCAPGGVQTCVDGASGCKVWSASTACPTGQSCSNGACVLGCQNECTAGATRCDGNGVQTCAMSATGCTAWGIAAGCSNGQVCKSGVCGDCSSTVDCDATQICTTMYPNRCAAAFPRTYILKVSSVSVPQRDLSNQTWDPNGGLPDLYVAYVLNGNYANAVLVTQTLAEDTTTGYWFDAGVEVPNLAETDTLEIFIIDDDSDISSSNAVQVIDSATLYQGALVRLGSISGPMYTGSSTQISLTMTPK